MQRGFLELSQTSVESENEWLLDMVVAVWKVVLREKKSWSILKNLGGSVV